MVKNVNGGNRAKGQARKFTKPDEHKTFRTAVEEGELYAQVTKMLGNGMCYVMGIDGDTRLCNIRGKFRGRGKRDNFISVGSWVLVGIRLFESISEKKIQNCDLLEVYNDLEKERLRNNVLCNWSIFTLDVSTTKEEDGFEFVDTRETDYDYRKTLEEKMNATSSETSASSTYYKAMDEDEEINIDDI